LHAHRASHRAKLAASAAALALVLASSGSRASGSLELTGAATAGNGLAARVFSRGAEATYYNPALLPDAKAATTVGFFALASHESIRLAARPAGVDVPTSVYNAQLRNPDGTTSRLELRPIATSELPAARGDTDETEGTTYVSLGVVRPLFGDKLVLGFYGVLPLTIFQRQAAFFPDEREQYFQNRLRFELLGDRLAQSSFAVALASRVASWISLGAGIDVTIGTVAKTAVHVSDAGDQREVLLNPEVEVSSTASPYFSVVTRPARSLLLTSTLHLPVSSETEGENRVRFWNYVYPEGEDAVRQVYSLSLAYEPMRFGLGARWTARAPDPNGWGLELGAQAVISRWSTYVDRHAERPLDPFRDTLSGTVGAALDLGGRRIGLDLAYAPSPVPPQDGRSNYVDGSRLSADLSFAMPVSVFGTKVDTVARAFGQLLLARQEVKRADARHPVVDELPDGATDVVTDDPIPGAAGLQTNNPGYPGYESSGWVIGGGVSVALPDR
jgi:long-chain fatty acid transport protein